MKDQEDIPRLVREAAQHRLRVADAKAYGVTEAILLYNLRFWVTLNKARGKHFHKGRTWSYNSYKAYTELFPYLSEWQIKRALASLFKQGAILKDNFNKKRYDRTNWYALSDESQISLVTAKPSSAIAQHNG